MPFTLTFLIVQDESDMSHLEICCCRGLSSPASCRNVSKLFHGSYIIPYSNLPYNLPYIILDGPFHSVHPVNPVNKPDPIDPRFAQNTDQK